eukprot:1331978-Pleurochrysis_carterae.AAC.1
MAAERCCEWTPAATCMLVAKHVCMLVGKEQTGQIPKRVRGYEVISRYATARRLQTGCKQDKQ